MPHEQRYLAHGYRVVIVMLRPPLVDLVCTMTAEMFGACSCGDAWATSLSEESSASVLHPLCWSHVQVLVCISCRGLTVHYSGRGFVVSVDQVL